MADSMRLDKYMSLAGVLSRSDTARAVRAGDILINGAVPKRSDTRLDADSDTVTYRGERVVYREFTYVLLNKPQGYVSATEDGSQMTVLELLPEELRRVRPQLFPCGRLDKNTMGLMILTNDGQLSHKLLSPKRHVDKTYRFAVKFPLSDADVTQLENGVDIGGYVTAPCKVTLIDCKNGEITIHEGKYHQIKLMMEAVHNQIVELERIRFGKITLPDDLPLGKCRLMTDGEITALCESVN
ncbi:MAG: rRNA pseudouridine synthase [Ruminococcaceae bacterium]|nr:rRNA pseudouridine synthase [Oscillospiraceae bacterium]